MSFRWDDFLDLAQLLVHEPRRHGPYSAVLRTAISRAYYACHHRARSFMAEEPDAYRRALTPSRSAHQDVIDYLKGSPEPTRQGVGEDLERLFLRRKDADYETVYPGGQPRLEDNASEAVETARAIIERLQRLRPA